jgi:hypothetical protein
MVCSGIKSMSESGCYLHSFIFYAVHVYVKVGGRILM